MLLKKLLPHSLFRRFLLIILLPNIIVQMVTIYIFYQRHWEGVSKHMAVALAGEMSMVVKSVDDQPPEIREQLIKLEKDTLYLGIDFIQDAKLKEDYRRRFSFDMLENELRTRLSRPYSVFYIEDNSRVAVDVQMDDGILRISSSKKRLENPSTYIFIMWMLGTAGIFLLISVLFMRNQVRAITTLATVAEKFGMGQDTDNFKPTGATEVRQVAQAFIDMRERIKKQVEQRTDMLAGVSHDLKTPLTRLKLQLAMMKPSKEIKELQDDIIEMEKMIQGYLDFAKGKERVIDAAVNVSDLLRSVIAGYRHQHKDIELKTKSGIIMHVNANAMRRVVTNIIDNALRYGKNIRINITSSAKNMILTIDDDGPGIPESKYEQAFRPFHRLDSSRHIESGNTGLGLSIAKDIIVGYGGDISLAKSPLGGLRVLIKLPL